jgi:hypothetical protein
MDYEDTKYPQTSTNPSPEGISPEVKAFLHELDPEDIKRLKSALKAYSAVEFLGTVFKWVAISAFALVVATSQLGDSVIKILKWFRI